MPGFFVHTKEDCSNAERAKKYKANVPVPSITFMGKRYKIFSQAWRTLVTSLSKNITDPRPYKGTNPLRMYDARTSKIMLRDFMAMSIAATWHFDKERGLYINNHSPHYTIDAEEIARMLDDPSDMDGSSLTRPYTFRMGDFKTPESMLHVEPAKFTPAYRNKKHLLTNL